MTLDDICRMTLRPSTLNALHACREGHPWNTPGANHWRNAFALAQQDAAVNCAAMMWIGKQAAQWERSHG